MLGTEIQKLVSRFNRQKRKVLSQHWIDEFYSLGLCPSRTQVPFGLFGQAYRRGAESVFAARLHILLIQAERECDIE